MNEPKDFEALAEKAKEEYAELYEEEALLEHARRDGKKEGPNILFNLFSRFAGLAPDLPVRVNPTIGLIDFPTKFAEIHLDDSRSADVVHITVKFDNQGPTQTYEVLKRGTQVKLRSEGRELTSSQFAGVILSELWRSERDALRKKLNKGPVSDEHDMTHPDDMLSFESGMRDDD